VSHEEKSKAWGRIKKEECPHVSTLGVETASAKDACEGCGWTEDLRICLTCGYVGCCESHAAHNTAHFKSSGHSLIRPHRSQSSWIWCYECNAFLE
jgi:uncharacterized UBP type Zn finger protein